MANEALHSSVREEDEGLIPLLVGDGRSLLVLTALALLFSGGFALFLAVRREFLPHDIQYLGMSAEALCAVGGGRVAAFIFLPAIIGALLFAVGIALSFPSMADSQFDSASRRARWPTGSPRATDSRIV